MFPFRHSSIFRNRWIALLWAAGIVWTAVDFAGSPQADKGNQSAEVSGPDAAEAEQAQKLLEDMAR